MPRSLPARALSRLRLPKPLTSAISIAFFSEAPIVAGVVGHDHRRLVRERFDEILLPQIGRIDAELARADLDQPLDHEGRLGPPGAAIGIDRHGVGVDRVDLAVDRRNVVLARQQRRVEIGRHRRREGRHIGAEIGDGLDLEPGDLAVIAERHLGVGDMVAAMRVGQERLGAVAGPFHRAADLLRGPQADDLFGIDENLRAEAAADVGRDDAQLVLGRHADEGRDDEPRHMRILRGVPEREILRAGVVFADRDARLHRVGHQPVVDDVEPGDVLGRLRTRRPPPWRRRDATDRSCSSARPRGSPARSAPWPDRSPPAAPRSRPRPSRRRPCACASVSAITTATGSPT